MSTLPRLILLSVMLALAVPVASPVQAQDYTQQDYDADVATMDRLFLAGDYAGAAMALRGIVARATASWGDSDPRTLHMETALANSLTELGEAGEALEIFRSVHARWLATRGAYAMDTLQSGLQLAAHLSFVGLPEEGLPLAIDAIRGAEALLGPDHRKTVYWRYSLARIFYEMGYWEEARAEYATARDKLLAMPDAQSQLYGAEAARRVAKSDMDLGDLALAADEYAQAVPLIEAAYGPAHPVLARTLAEHARVLQRLNDPALLEILDRADRVIKAAMGPRSVLEAELLSIRALSLAQGSDPGSAGFEQSIALMRDSVAILEETYDQTAPSLGKEKLDLAAMLSATGRREDLTEALALVPELRAAQYLSRNFVLGLYGEAAEAGVLSREEAAKQAFQVMQETQYSPAARAAKTLAARLALGDDPAAIPFREQGDLIQEQSSLQEQILAEAALPADERDAARLAGLRQRAGEVAIKIDRLYKELAAVPSVADLTGGGVLTLAEVQALLAPDEALVVVDIGPYENDRHFIIAVSSDRVAFHELLWTTDSFVSMVADLRAAISLQLGVRGAVPLDGAEAGPDTAFSPGVAAWLYAETLGKVADVTEGKAHLYLDLRGPMASVPPHLMVVNDTAEADPARVDWLVRHHAISILPSVFSLKTIALARNRPPAPDPLLAYADPDFAREEDLRLAALETDAAVVVRGALSPLPETVAEAEDVAAALGAGDTAVRVGAAASEADVKAAPLDRYRVLHFATHGLISGDAVGETVLAEPALALTAGQGEDGFLTASEVLKLRLNADLVVLSACNTAFGDDPDAQALSGLAQAFFYAGARGLLVSHWPVESRSAARLMTDTFRIRAETPGLRAAEAERQAMVAMIESGRWSHPAYWAPFVLVGNPD